MDSRNYPSYPKRRLEKKNELPGPYYELANGSA